MIIYILFILTMTFAVTYSLYVTKGYCKEFFHNILHVHVPNETFPAVYVDGKLWGVCKYCGEKFVIDVIP